MSSALTRSSALCNASTRHTPSPSKVEGGRLSDRLALTLQTLIEEGRYPAGSRLPTEQELTQVHRVSRTVVREALHQLKSQGLVHSRQGSGVYVNSDTTRQAFKFAPTILATMDDVVQMIELRRVIEGEMAALAALRATHAHKAALRQALNAIDEATSSGRLGVDEDLRFHRLIGEATGNAQFVRLLSVFEVYLRDAMTVTKTNESKRADHMAQVRREHAAICQAIEDGNAAAAREAVRTHHTNGEVRLVDSGVIRRR